MKTATLLITVIFLAVFDPVVRAQDMTLETAPPVVVKTVPEAGTKDVDPAATEIKVTFSKDMQDHSWSWSTAWKDSTPQSGGAPKYLDDKRTCVLPVKLESGKVYGFWLNSEKFHNFKDSSGHPAVPYLLYSALNEPLILQTDPLVQNRNLQRAFGGFARKWGFDDRWSRWAFTVGLGARHDQRAGRSFFDDLLQLVAVDDFTIDEPFGECFQ